MAFPHSLQFSQPCCRPSPKFSSSTSAAAAAFSLPQLKPKTALSLNFLHNPFKPRRISARGTENGSETASEPETTTSTTEKGSPEDSGEGGADGGEGELSDVGAEIKKMLKERESREEKGGLLSGVAEEIGEIEWPDFRKVLGTTGVVLGVIAGSSVVLLTVNAILAELSDRVFAGKGIQDFFG